MHFTDLEIGGLSTARAVLLAACTSFMVPAAVMAADKPAAAPSAPAPKELRSDAARQNERVEIILSGLPVKESPEYQSLFALAGDAVGQVLPLTKCEVWAVRPSVLQALTAEATKRGIIVSRLGGDWNRMLNPMTLKSQMDGKARSMMDQAMQSPSTSSVGMMSPRQANMMEYALTKGMNDPSKSHDKMSVSIALNSTTSITAIRREVSIKGNRCVWRGVVEGTENPVTIMWWGSGRMTGTIHHAGRIFQLKQMGKDMIGVIETMTDRMPDEHPRTSPQRLRKMKAVTDDAFMKGDASIGRPPPQPRPTREDSRDTRDDASNATPSLDATRLAGINPKQQKSANQAGALDATAREGVPSVGGGNAVVTIDLMLAYTAKAAAQFGNIKLDLIELAVDEAEQSFRNSGLPNLRLRLVHTHETDYAEEGVEHFDHVWRMVDKGDGYMEEIPPLRDMHKADVVILIVDDNKGCGLATRVAADAAESYAVVHHECAATTYSLAHEIGHIIGARHDRLQDKTGSPFPFGHGFVDPDQKWRTMMSYKAGCNGCPRSPVWSSPLARIRGAPAGDSMTDNARVLRENAERVARFR